MKKTIRQGLALVMAFLLAVGGLAGCGDTDNTGAHTPTGTPDESGGTEAGYWDLLDEVADTSDLPTWTGKQLKLVEWLGHGSGSAARPVAGNDVVTPEIKRVTGVELDAENSFDNGGSSIDVKMSLLAAAQDWPDIINTTNTQLVKDLVASGELYDLTDLLPEYCPDVMKLFDTAMFPRINENITATVSDRIYFVPAEASREYAGAKLMKDPAFNAEQWSRIESPSPVTDWTRTWVRDDILKKMYPNAKTQDEIEALYLKNGGFSSEEIFDVPIRSWEDYLKFLTDMKALIDTEKIQENGKPVEVTFAACGADNWALMSCMLMQFYGVPGGPNYFTYYDKKQEAVVRTIDQPWFQSMINDFRSLIASGVVSKESLLDNQAVFNEKLNSGQYALTYAWLKPDANALKEAGKTYRYRQLWPDLEYDYGTFATVMSPYANGLNIGIFKDSVSEEDLPQVLRYLNYMMSDVGTKLQFWGPKSAGLFTEENGVRRYTDKELEDNMVYNVQNQRNIYYNLLNYFAGVETDRTAWPLYPVGLIANFDHPKYVYTDVVLNVGDADNFFQPGMLPGLSKAEHHVYAQKGQSLTDFNDQWNVFGKGRDAFEKALMSPLAAKDDAEFKNLWNELAKTTDSVGLNQSMLEDINKLFFELNPTIIEDAAKISK